MRFLKFLALVVSLQLALAVNFMYDETGWTKLDWHKYRIDYSTLYDPIPSEEVIKNPDIRKALAQCRINSLDGPYERSTEKRPPGLWSLEDGSLVQTPEEDSIEAAAEAMTCTVCHGLISHVWQQVVAAIHKAEPLNEGTIGDMFEEACEVPNVPTKVLQKYRIVKVDAPEAGVSLFVVRNRPGSTSLTDARDTLAGTKTHPGTEAEVTAAYKSCRDLASHHQEALVKPIWKQAGDYFIAYRNLGRRMLSKMKMDADDIDEYEDPETDEEDTHLEQKALQHIPENRLMKWEALCLDLEILCPLWASLGECSSNPKYMIGTSRKLGHCRKSCGQCSPDATWSEHPVATKQLAATASTLLNTLRNTACTSSEACMAGAGGSSIPGAAAVPVKVNEVHQNAAVLPGAALARQGGFVLGKPFWAVPEVLPNPEGGAASGDSAGDPADALLLSKDLSSQLLQIPGMDGFFIYQLHYKHRVYQFHMDSATGKVTEEHVLGHYHQADTELAAERDREAPATPASKAWHAQQRAFKDGRQATSGSNASSSSSKTSETDTASAAATAQRDTGSKQKTPDIAATVGSKAATDADTSQRPSGSRSADGGSEDTADSTMAISAQDISSSASVTAAADSPEPLDKWAKYAPPMLELLDYLPDTVAMLDSYWPYYRQMYAGGEPCGSEGKHRPRTVELRVACSPTNSMHMLIREPQFCQYVMVLYHPELCNLLRYKPVSKAAMERSAGDALVAENKTAQEQRLAD